MRLRQVIYLLLALLLISCRPAAETTPEAPIQPTLPALPPTPLIATAVGNELQPDVPTPPLATATVMGAAASPQPQATAPTVPPAASDDPFTLGAAAGVPAPLVTAAQELAAANPQLFTWLDATQGTPDVLLAVNQGQSIATWVYAVAAPFATVTDGVAFDALAAGWQAGSSELGTLLLPADSAAALKGVFGGPSPAATAGPDLVGELWAGRPSWTILPFEQLRPELKALAVDGQSTLSRGFDAAAYPLTIDVGVSGAEPGVAAFLAAYQGPATNRDDSRLTRVAMSGVTALVRATAYQMEQNGVLYPGEEVAPVLQSADIAHVSNEVSFMSDCPYPDPYGGVTFCSADRYFELLQSLGVDVVELTGNHVNDYGREPLAHTLDMYAAAGMQWFGGGRDLADASRAAVFDHNGNRIAFVGCNPVGPPNDWAIADGAGSRPCGPDMMAQISQLRDEGAVVLATLQYLEDYQYAVGPQQVAAFSELAQAGAAGVSGSQGHHVQGFGFVDGNFIHYGLGNLFFDQMDMLGTRQSLVDTYVVYDGRVISVELWTGLIENWARPRLMTAEERADTLQTLFQASGW